MFGWIYLHFICTLIFPYQMTSSFMRKTLFLHFFFSLYIPRRFLKIRVFYCCNHIILSSYVPQFPIEVLNYLKSESKYFLSTRFFSSFNESEYEKESIFTPHQRTTSFSLWLNWYRTFEFFSLKFLLYYFCIWLSTILSV